MMKIVRYVGPRGSSDKEYQDALKDGEHVVIDTLPKGANVVIRFSRDDHPVKVALRPLYRDFLDLATAVYVSDELEAREDAQDGWSRTFEHLYPVSDPAAWSSAGFLLAKCLSKLSGDEFGFTWLKRGGIPLFPNSRRPLPRGFDAVCLFSGGIDSLLGAWQLLSAGKRLILVGHQADGLTAAAQTQLAAELAGLFPGCVALVQTRVSRAGTKRPRFALPKKVEETHRPRSFLFLALAVCVAHAAGVAELYMPENGLIALNPPLQVSRMGTLSTRTAHPVYLAAFRDLVRALGVFNGPIRNPFLYESKTDMLRSLDPRLHTFVLRSVSCARPSRYQDRGVRHCGYCVPCLFRRAAMVEAGIDQASDYALDVFTEFPEMTWKTQADFKALIPFAAFVAAAADAQLENLVLAHGAFPPSIGAEIGPHGATDYSPWTGMMRRWARHFLSVLDQSASRKVKRYFGLTNASQSAAVP
jgi:7-cyano-7-deazaguanine synthase in queuosine biosynthesis